MADETQGRKAWDPVTPEDRQLVSSALEEILASPPFRGSRRYPAMLRYVVQKTLDHQKDALKERTIGVEVFGRDPLYDTSADPVVRFSAGEIRRRIAQFYQQTHPATDLVLDLPPGAYIPRFSRTARPAAEDPQLENSGPTRDFAVPEGIASAADSAAVIGGHSKSWIVYCAFAAMLVLAGTVFAVLRIYALRDPVAEVWHPLMAGSDPVLISAGRPLVESELPEKPDGSIRDHILRPEFRVSITTLSAIAKIVGYLNTKQRAFRIHEANSNTLADLHQRPVVLVTGNNNKWTVLLLKPLRFRMIQETPDYSYIEDTQHPDFRGWSLDFRKPFNEQTADYAIVARFQSATTGAPVVVVAGISSNGTEAAGDFIVSPDALAKLARSNPAANLNENFEAVIKVDVVGGNNGEVSILASEFWP